MFVCCECCMMSCRGLCDELITRPEESYRLWCVVVRDLITCEMRGPWPTGGLSHQKQTKAANIIPACPKKEKTKKIPNILNEVIRCTRVCLCKIIFVGLVEVPFFIDN